MGRLTAAPIVLLFAPLFLLLSSCGTGGSGGAASPPPEPLTLAEMEPGLPDDPPPATELFVADEPVHFVLAADFDQLKKDRSQESEERPGQVLVRGPSGEAVEIPIKVKTRGNFRLQRRTCSDPPLRLNFPESDPQGTIFDGQDKLKLVTHCRDSDRYEQNVVEEYLVYRLYNQLTDIGFRVQLAEIAYMDSSGDDDPVKRMAFLLEEEDAMAARLDGSMIEAPTTSPDNFDLDQLSLMYLFNFMVGNIDWGTGASHNVKILQADYTYYPIPYDFDWSGFVDAPYAGPNPLTEHLHDNVRDRVYWGVCLPGIDYQARFAQFNEVQDTVLALIRNQVGLTESNKKSAEEYILDFYEIINDPWKAERDIMKACRSWK